MDTVRMGTAAPSVEDVVAVVDGARVELDGAARASMAAARAVVDDALAAGTAVYGLTTQVGHGRNTRLTEEEIRDEQEFLVMSHAGGLGPALPVPQVRAAMAVERRMAHLWDEFFAQPASSPPTSTHGLQLRYPAAAVVAELEQEAAPATLDVPPPDLGIEDHATGAPLSVGRTGTALGLLADLLAVELLLAAETLTRRPTARALGAGTAAALDLVREVLEEADPYPDGVHRALRTRFPDPGPERLTGAGPPDAVSDDAGVRADG